MIDHINPFYIYAENNCLYIKNINEKIKKVSNNIVSYCANFDENNFIHICSIDTKGRLNHFIYKNGHIKKRVLCKVCHNINNLRNMRLFIVQNYLNIFIIEESSLKNNQYRLSHFNFSPSNYNIYKYCINNIVKINESIYKLNIDDMYNMILTYGTTNKDDNSDLYNKTLIFNTYNRNWLPARGLLRQSTSISDFKSFSTIKDDLFEYCYSIIYKNN